MANEREIPDGITFGDPKILHNAIAEAVGERYIMNTVLAMDLIAELGRLRAENDRLRFELKAAQEEIKIADAEIDRLRALYLSEADRLNAEIERLYRQSGG